MYPNIFYSMCKKGANAPLIKLCHPIMRKQCKLQLRHLIHRDQLHVRQQLLRLDTYHKKID